jgi:protease-4
MSQSETPVPTPGPGQTIIIERRERGGIFRRIILPVVMLLLVLSLLGSLFTAQSGLPTRLSERYVAGDITAAKVAIVAAEGLLMDAQVDNILRQIRQARDDDKVLAIVLRVDSPGGGVSAADRIWRELSLVKKPLVASFGDTAASGGYYIAATAQRIFAEPTTLTGSIGVILEMPQVGELLDKVGVKMETVTSGPWKDAGSMFHRALTPEERSRWQAVIEPAYERFLRVVAQGRKLPLDRVRPAADGRILTAQEALDLKLVDQIGYLDDAVREAWRLARVESTRVIRYAMPFSFAEALPGLATRAPALDPQSLLRATSPRLLYLAR